MNKLKQSFIQITQYIKKEARFFALLSILPLFIGAILFSSNPNIIWTAPLSACSFYIFTSLSSLFNKTPHLFRFALATAYALSALVMSGNFGISTKVVYLLLPFFAISFEQFIIQSRATPLCIMFVLLLCVDAVYAITIFAFSVLFYIIFMKKPFGNLIADILHLCILFVLSLFTTAPVSCIKIESLLNIIDSTSYTGFSFTYPIFTFISRFFHGMVSASVFGNIQNIDLGIGIILICLFVLFFTNNTIQIEFRIRTFIFTTILLLLFETTPGLYCLELFQTTNLPIVQYGILNFWIVTIGGISLSRLSGIRSINLLVGCGLASTLVAVTLLFTSHNLTNYGFILCIFAILIYIAFTLSNLLSKNKLAKFILTFGICAEAFAGCYLTATPELQPQNPNINSLFAFQSQNKIQTDTDKLLDWPYTKEGNDYLGNHIALDLHRSLKELNRNVQLDKDEILSYNPTGIISDFDLVNLKCHKIGISEDMFTKIEDYSISFPQEYPELYNVVDMGNHIYNIETTELSNQYETDIFIPFTYEIHAPASDEVFLYDTYTTFIIRCDSEGKNIRTGTSYIRMSQTAHFMLNDEISAYSFNQNAYDQLADALKQYMMEHQSVFSSTRYVIYLILMLLGLIVFAIFTMYTDIDSINKKLYSAKNQFANYVFFQKIAVFFRHNQIYLFAFFIPFILFILSMIVYSCAPFGSMSFLDCDGPSSVLAGHLNYYYNYKNGTFFVSSLGGYVNELSVSLLFPLTLFTLLFSPSQLPAFFILSEAFLVGLSGFTICYYLTHRLYNRKAFKEDYRLLIPALIYSINAYMLAMHSYCYWWYLLFCLFPIVILQLERLLYQKKWFLYVILLSVCITTNFNIALYICIYLVIHFMICEFDNLKDFFVKGVRFGICSLLAAGCGLSGWLYILTSKTNSGYNYDDSIFPTPGFHTSFFNQWTKFMIFSPTGAISHNPGDVNIYMSLLMLLLLGIFFISKNIPKEKKLRFLFPMLFLLISFNGNVLSYVWNGLHYQSGVPNRYIFIWMFLCSAISYDSLREIKKISNVKKVLIFIAPIILLCICQLFGTKQKSYAFWGSLILIALYSILIFLRSRIEWLKHNLYRVLVLLLTTEMFANMLFVCHSYCLNNLQAFGDYGAKAETNQTLLSTNDEFVRFSIANYYGMNFGFFNNVPTNQIFVSTLSTQMQNINFYYGLLNGGNFITSNYNSTPFGISSAAIKYITLPMYASSRQLDMQNYKYIGYQNEDFYFENEDALSLGYYLPENFQFASFQRDVIPCELYNYIAKTITGNNDDIFTVFSIQKSSEEHLPDNSFQFLDIDGNIISSEEANNIITSDDAQSTGTLPCQKLFVKINATARKDGELYIYLNEFVSLGYAKEGETKSITIKYPNQSLMDWDEYYCFTMDKDAYKQYIAAAKKNQLQGVSFKDTVIEGTSDYQADGYTIFSIPYSDKWHAYIDDKEVETYDYNSANLFIKTPAGRHQIKLVYDTNSQIVTLLLSIAFYLVCIFAYYIQKRKEKRSL